jgi:hypothetical protein
VARPAAGAGRQAQVAGLLLSALACGCASQGQPPGGPPRTTPAAIVRTVPESGAVVPDFRGKAVIQFDEVIDEAPGSSRGGGGAGGAGGGGGGGGAGGGAITGLAQKIVLSPVAGDVKVSWHRSAIHVQPEEGWKPNRAYHLEVLPGIADLRRNVTKTGTMIVFSTGGALPGAALTGTALLWVEQRPLAQAVIRAAPLPDTAAYVALTDSGGNFRLSEIPAGRYRVWAIQDQNNNRRQDRREAFDTVTVTVDSSASAVLWVFVHDTIGPRVRAVEAVDSVSIRISFSQPLDPARPPDTAAVRVFALPDTTPVGVRALFRPAQFDSMQARARVVADSLKRLQDTTARRDTSRARPTPPAAPPRAPAARAPRDTGTARVDTAGVRKLLSQRPVPYDRLVVQTVRPLTPGAKYLVRVRGAINLSGVAADALGVVEIPVPKPAPSDSAKAKAP